MKLTKDQIKDFEIREKEANCCDDFYNVASELIELGNKEWAIKLCKKAELLDLDNSEIVYLASLIGSDYGLSDKDWARKLYKKAETNAEDAHDLIQLANKIAGKYSVLEDDKWAIEILHKSIKKLEASTDSNDPNYFAGVAHNLACLGDKKSAIELFKKAEEKMDYQGGFLELAQYIHDPASIGDKEWALKVYEKAEDLAESSNDILELAKFKAEINDVEEVKELILKAIEIDDNIQGKINTVRALTYAYIIEDTEWINSLKPGIIKLVKDKYAKFEGYEFQFGLESWGKNLHSGEPTWITLIIKNGIPTITNVYLSDEGVDIKDDFHENDSISNFGLWPQSNDSDGLINVYDVIDPDSHDEYIEPVLNICISQHSYDVMEVPTGEFSKYESLSSLDQDGVLFLAEVMNLSLSKFFK